MLEIDFEYEQIDKTKQKCRKNRRILLFFVVYLGNNKEMHKFTFS